MPPFTTVPSQTKIFPEVRLSLWHQKNPLEQLFQGSKHGPSTQPSTGTGASRHPHSFRRAGRVPLVTLPTPIADNELFQQLLFLLADGSDGICLPAMEISRSWLFRSLPAAQTQAPLPSLTEELEAGVFTTLFLSVTLLHNHHHDQQKTPPRSS